MSSVKESPPKSIHVSYVIGESAKLKYKSKVLDFDNALKRSHWEKNASLISRTDKISFGINKNKRKFWLKIKKVDVHDSGIYSFVVDGTVLRLWQLNIQVADSSLKHCGWPFHEIGKSLNVQGAYHLYNGIPIIQVNWTAPNTGFGDLWGYQVYISGKEGHLGHYDCVQINR
ncbi:hypothetical protein pdam_00021955, partial [Pocillopora damicornis]